MPSTPNLRDHLLNGLRDIPGTREFHIHVLVSSPRKFQGLFPYAHPRPRSYLQDVLVLLSEQSTPDSPRIFTTAIEASVYNIPTTSCAILYVSKVDTTGQSTSPSPAVTLVQSFLTYYADPTTRPVSADHLWIHLFARAQSQYLFPNSADFDGKHPLSDVKLCAWWKRVFSAVADTVGAHTDTAIRLYYILPGFSQLEAEHSISRAAVPSTSDVTERSWIYGHPYSQSDIPLPCPAPAVDLQQKCPNLGHFIPTFDDDPKSRFMDEIGLPVDGEALKSPPKKRARTTAPQSKGPAPPKNQDAEKEGQGGKEERILGELGKVSTDEFWERMSFRQECVAGAVTGFFVGGFSSSSAERAASGTSPLAPLPGQVSCQLNKRVLSSLMTALEFSTVERSIKATETLEGAIRGLCEGLAPAPIPPRTAANTNARGLDRRTPEPEPSRALLAPPSTPPRRGSAYVPDVSPNPFPEPVTSLETYNSHIYGSISVRNPPLAAKSRSQENSGVPREPAPHVTVLAVRKKKKRVE
ncbi:histone acetylation protein-domain-containing protein [Favolaschia claudopus]|uniref:histone acetyltransferase n=1 Tax=Favolaschia claudopus TaxID=2862362 RepID=A0AAW0DAV0_9AGAR